MVRASDLSKALRGPGFEAVKGGRDVLQFLYIFYFSRIQKKTIRKRGKKKREKNHTLHIEKKPYVTHFFFYTTNEKGTLVLT